MRRIYEVHIPAYLGDSLIDSTPTLAKAKEVARQFIERRVSPSASFNVRSLPHIHCKISFRIFGWHVTCGKLVQAPQAPQDLSIDACDAAFRGWTSVES